MSEENHSRARTMVIVLLLIGFGIAVFWLLTRSQPIVTIRHSGLKTTRSSILKTNEITTLCLTCSGRGYSRINRSNQSRNYNNYGTNSLYFNKPCAVCGGKGVLYAAGNYSQKKETQDALPNVTVQADLSIWERTLAAIGIDPEINASPQRALNGSVPLVEQYLALNKPDGPDYEIVLWHPAEASGSGWIQKVTCRVQQEGKSTELTRSVFIMNRRIIRSTLASP